MVEKSAGTRCGTHTELAKTEGARITRCACGTIHLHLSRSGVSVQLPADAFLEVAAAVIEARNGLAADGAVGGHAGEIIN